MRVPERKAARREALNLPIEARRVAEDTLLDRTVFTVSPKQYRQFLARLDAPSKPNKRLLKSMLIPAPWE